MNALSLGDPIPWLDVSGEERKRIGSQGKKEDTPVMVEKMWLFLREHPDRQAADLYA